MRPINHLIDNIKLNQIITYYPHNISVGFVLLNKNSSLVLVSFENDIGDIILLQQILVVSPSGPCFVHRNYDQSANDVDPQLLSAMIALGSSGSVQLSEITRILRQDTIKNPNSNIEIIKTHNYIACAISSNYDNRTQVLEILPRVNQMTYEILGNPKDIISIEGAKIDRMEHRIDLLLIKEGLIQG